MDDLGIHFQYYEILKQVCVIIIIIRRRKILFLNEQQKGTSNLY